MISVRADTLFNDDSIYSTNRLVKPANNHLLIFHKWRQSSHYFSTNGLLFFHSFSHEIHTCNKHSTTASSHFTPVSYFSFFKVIKKYAQRCTDFGSKNKKQIETAKITLAVFVCLSMLEVVSLRYIYTQWLL